MASVMQPADEFAEARESMTMRIKCLHCFRTHVDPRQLPCGHVFCLACLETVFNVSSSLGSFVRRRTSTAFSRRTSGYLLCPNCKLPCTVPTAGPSGFPGADEAVDDAKRSAIDELSKLLQIKYRRRTTGNIPQQQQQQQLQPQQQQKGQVESLVEISGRFPLLARSQVDLLVEENEAEAENLVDSRGSHRHSYPSSRPGHVNDDAPDARDSGNYKGGGGDDVFDDDDRRLEVIVDRAPIKEEEEEEGEEGEERDEGGVDKEDFENLRFERIRRSRRSNRNLRSNLRPTSEYGHVSPKSGSREEEAFSISAGAGRDAAAGRESAVKDRENDFEGEYLPSDLAEMSSARSRRSRLIGSRSFSTLDQNKSYVSTTRRCFSLRDKIRRDTPSVSSDPLGSRNFDSARKFSSASSSSIPSSSRFSSFDGGGPTSLSDVGPPSSTASAPKSDRLGSRFKSAPENFSSSKSTNGFPVIDEIPSFRPTRSRYSNNGSRFSSDNVFGSAQEPKREPRHVSFSEDEIRERLLKYRETPENAGSAKLDRISDESFCLPSGIACLPGGRVAVADHGYNSILLLDSDWSTTRARITGIKPFGVSYSDPTGILYAADRRSRTVLLYDSTSGEKLDAWRDGQFGWICGVEVLGDTGTGEQIAVLDRSGSCVRICDCQTGTTLLEFGSYGSEDDQFCMAEFMTWDRRRGCLLLSDSGNHRVVAFDPRQGSPSFSFGRRGHGDDGQLQWPKGICVDRNGCVYVADSGNRRISRFTADGCFVEHAISPINAPYTVAVEGSDFESKTGRSLCVTTFSLQNKAQLFRYLL